jgi:hypothetical protein
MNREELIKKITEKQEFSQLPSIDVELAFKQFEKRQCSDEEKIDLTRNLLRKVFSAFTSHKILSLKDKDEEWILRKHLSTRERLPYYKNIYQRILEGMKEKSSILDLGAGINGLSYKYFPKKVNYVAIESMGQLVNLTNFFFDKNKLSGEAIFGSLFELKKIKKKIKETKGEKIILLLKVIDSLEMLERDYSKKLLLEITPLAKKVIVSFATRSMLKREKFNVNRGWIIEFIKKNFKMLDEFEFGGEKYLVFCKQ